VAEIAPPTHPATEGTSVEIEEDADVWLRTREDAVHFVAALARRTTPATATMIFGDRSGKVVEMFCIEGGADHLPDLVEFTCSPDEEDVCCLLLVTDRSGETPADRPDDELTWVELHASARDGGVELLDWFVTSGRWMFSIAEFAPIQAAWGNPTWGRGISRANIAETDTDVGD
jgi:hypothetical protein